MTTIWSSTVTRIGDDAPEMIEEGVIILFGEPVPDALADVSLVHSGGQKQSRDLVPGDAISIGKQSFEIVDLGELANGNLAELGHVVLYVNQPDQQLLPGAIHARGQAVQIPKVGASITVTGT